MLGKLIKYDLKYGAKMFTVFHTVLLIACTTGHFFLNNIILYEDKNIVTISMASVLFLPIMILLFVSVSIGMALLLAVRFYKNFFTDEGYLTWTLPATPAQHLWAKTLSGSIWYTAHILLSTLALMILLTCKNMSFLWTFIAPKVTKIIGVPLELIFLYFFLYILINTLCSIVIIYACISIGQLFSGHKVFCSVVAYFILSFIFHLLTLIVTWLMDLIPSESVTNTANIDILYSFQTLAVNAVFSLAITAIPYIISLYILKKKVNLS